MNLERIISCHQFHLLVNNVVLVDHHLLHEAAEVLLHPTIGTHNLPVNFFSLTALLFSHLVGFYGQ